MPKREIIDTYLQAALDSVTKTLVFNIAQIEKRDSTVDLTTVKTFQHLLQKRLKELLEEE